MTEQEIIELEKWIHVNLFDGDKFVGLMKRGLWYRPNSAGYTDMPQHAGRYTRDKAKEHEHIIPIQLQGGFNEDQSVTIHEFPVPQYARNGGYAMDVLKKCVEKFGDESDDSIMIAMIAGKTIVCSNEIHYDGNPAATLELAICLFAKNLLTTE